MIFYAQNAIFLYFFCRSLRSRFILSLSPPLDKVHAPPKVKSWIRHWLLSLVQFSVTNKQCEEAVGGLGSKVAGTGELRNAGEVI